MRHELDSFQHELDEQRLFQQFEQGIRGANSKAIGETIGRIDAERFLAVAVKVSELRAAYLAKVVALGAATPEATGALLDELRAARGNYVEALEGFGALRHALKRGYFELKG
ncbi:hypothetical protein [Oceanibacterium hippocampi]|uniref:Uncharacterized protein n=1 Tax=Oceanibacterium hippocampi TaxID=745714 RepID=A0A1Y5SS01_9PROT|nr:hypothetical protein [Oceanibacterium hippocampi]SLN45607.1 hypothetical protein OCH7691_01967 [Oceanibacterium hippocampi]